MKYTRIFIILITLFMAYTSHAQTTDALISRKLLFSPVDKSSVTLSHDGKYLAYIAPVNGVANIFLAPSNEPDKAQAITYDKGRGIHSITWAYNNQHIIFNQDENGDENFRLYSYNLKNKAIKLLTPQKGVVARFAAASPQFPNEILITTNERDKKYFDLYKLNLADGTTERMIENNRFLDFVTDNDFNIRFAKLTNKDGDNEYYQYQDKNWKLYMKISLEDAQNTNFLWFDKLGNNVYLLDSRNRDTAALKTINLKTGESQVIAEDNRADLQVLTFHPTDFTIQAVTVDYDRVSYNILDSAIKNDMKYLQQLHKGDIYIHSRTLDDNQWLVLYVNDISPSQYYLYNRKNKIATFLFNGKKELEKYKLSPMYPVSIKSRDNMDLISYISFPASIKLDKNLRPKEALPLVLLVHGGPWWRDRWGFNPEHQWLANRGYAVLSVNFRGSTGLGKKFLNAGNLQWSKKMHDDLIDSVNWVVDNKIADPKKIAIMGISYGGYATLVGLSFTPDVFSCGVDIVGPSNILTLINSVPPYWGPLLNEFKKRIGPWDTEEQKNSLLQASPLTFADKIKKPLFIAQGANDPRVKQAESDQIVKAMRSKNIPVIYALYADEGHGFIRTESNLSFYALTEQFFAKILGGRSEPIGTDLQGANLLLNDKKVDSREAQKIMTTF